MRIDEFATPIPARPTAVVMGQFGSTRVYAKLYGTVTPERLARERKTMQWRAEQLTPLPKPVESARVFYRPDDEFDAFDE